MCVCVCVWNIPMAIEFLFGVKDYAGIAQITLPSYQSLVL